jgi:hypothetical protein
MRRLTLFLAAAFAITLMGPAPVAANNDPHRSFMPSGAFDAVGVCSFGVYLDVLSNNEYATVSTLPDDSTAYAVTGAMKVSLTNDGTGKTIELNVSGPGVNIYSADGTTYTWVARGDSLFFGYDLPDFGFPSNLVYTNGLMVITSTATNVWWGGWLVTGTPHFPAHVTDVCAALS